MARSRISQQSLLRLFRRPTRTLAPINNRKVTSEKSLSVDATPEQDQIFTQQKQNEEVQQYTELVRDFLDPADFYRSIRNIGIDFFCGIPDSLLKNFCAYVTAHTDRRKHVITANEGSAIALAAGYHMATKKFAMVYLQNSGLGNCVNPLTSLTPPQVYGLPMLLLVGWRGEPGKRDEPQHMHKGYVTPGLLATVGIPFQVLPDYKEGAEQALYDAQQHMERSSSPYALLVRRQTFLSYKLPKGEDTYHLGREEAVQTVSSILNDYDVVVATTGMLSRELFEYRARNRQGHERDFLTVGSMGHASTIALGIALSKPSRQIWCLDGDGALIMHLGALATVGETAPGNFKHIVINNESHDSVGGQPTAARHGTFDIPMAAKACGYREAFTAVTRDEVLAGIDRLHSLPGPVLLEIKTNRGSRKDLGRPTRSPQENKHDFMKFLSQ